jgi:hypothetical protein
MREEMKQLLKPNESDRLSSGQHYLTEAQLKLFLQWRNNWSGKYFISGIRARMVPGVSLSTLENMMTEFPETRSTLLVSLKTPENREAWEEFVVIYRPLIYRMARLRKQEANGRQRPNRRCI